MSLPGNYIPVTDANNAATSDDLLLGNVVSQFNVQISTLEPDHCQREHHHPADDFHLCPRAQESAGAGGANAVRHLVHRQGRPVRLFKPGEQPIWVRPNNAAVFTQITINALKITIRVWDLKPSRRGK